MSVSRVARVYLMVLAEFVPKHCCCRYVCVSCVNVTGVLCCAVGGLSGRVLVPVWWAVMLGEEAVEAELESACAAFDYSSDRCIDNYFPRAVLWSDTVGLYEPTLVSNCFKWSSYLRCSTTCLLQS